MEIARGAEAGGFDSLWIGEMMTFDAFALASAIARETSRIRLMVGPLAVGVRSPAMFALGIGSVAALGGRAAGLALGASNPLVVSGWHGRDFAHPVSRMRETIAALRPMLAGERSPFDGRFEKTAGFRAAGEPSRATVAVAAFGDRMLEVAATLADRVVVNLVTPAQAARTRARIDEIARSGGIAPPPLTAWIPVAIDPGDAAMSQLARQLVVYVGAPGYGEMFAEAGFGDVVALARSGAHPRNVLASIPAALARAIGAVGSTDEVRARIAEFRQAGVDEIAVVPVTAEDAGAKRLLERLSPR